MQLVVQQVQLVVQLMVQLVVTPCKLTK